MAICKVLFEKIYTNLALLTMGLFWGGCSRIGGTKKAPLPKIYLTYPTMMTLGSYALSKKDPKNIEIT